MNKWKDHARWKAAAAAALLVLAGGLLGVVADRVWLLPSELEAMPLTAEAMSARLDLSPPEEARIRALLDTLHAEVTVAARQGPDALVAAARRAHLRLEAALPPHARAGFRAWIQDHHHQMMERMGGAPMHGQPDGPGHHEDR